MRIMKRVYGFWFVQSMIPLFIIEFLAIGAGLYLVARFVFVSRVVENALIVSFGKPLHLISYFWNAFLNAGLLVQGLIALLLIALGFILRDLNRSLISYAFMRRSEFSRAREGDSHE